PLVEIVDSLLTDPAISARAESFVVGRLGKTAIKSPDRAGFVVNALLFPYLLSAIRMVDTGLASVEVVD
ncbi:dehydrogenase, partial [Streptomyces sp. SID11233]|nr:dehydrogenase [Streptomyces sp. SID11233]